MSKQHKLKRSSFVVMKNDFDTCVSNMSKSHSCVRASAWDKSHSCEIHHVLKHLGCFQGLHEILASFMKYLLLYEFT